jgi:hypothetical protein
MRLIAVLIFTALYVHFFGKASRNHNIPRVSMNTVVQVKTLPSNSKNASMNCPRLIAPVAKRLPSIAEYAIH